MERSEVDAALRIDSTDPLQRKLAYLRLLEEVLGGDWVERWAREKGYLEALREWRSKRPAYCNPNFFISSSKRGSSLSESAVGSARK